MGVYSLSTQQAREVYDFIYKYTPHNDQRTWILRACAKARDNISWHHFDGSSPDLLFYSEVLSCFAYAVVEHDEPQEGWPEFYHLLN